MSNLVSQTYYIYSTVQRYDKEREKTNKFRFYLNILSSLPKFIIKNWVLPLKRTPNCILLSDEDELLHHLLAVPNHNTLILRIHFLAGQIVGC